MEQQATQAHVPTTEEELEHWVTEMDDELVAEDMEARDLNELLRFARRLIADLRHERGLVAELAEGLGDIAEGRIPASEEPPLTDRAIFTSKMWSWSQKKARALLAKSQEPAPCGSCQGVGYVTVRVTVTRDMEMDAGMEPGSGGYITEGEPCMECGGSGQDARALLDKTGAQR